MVCLCPACLILGGRYGGRLCRLHVQVLSCFHAYTPCFLFEPVSFPLKACGHGFSESATKECAGGSGGDYRMLKNWLRRSLLR